MTLPVPVPLAFGRFKQLPQRTNEVWQGGLVRLPAWISHPTDPDGEPYRPIGALWVSLRTGLVHLALPDEGTPASPELALSALLEFGLKWAKELEARPARIEVREAALREALAEPLARLSTSVVVVDDLSALREVLDHMEADAAGGQRIPGLLESQGVTLGRLRGFAEAAACFYRARPWEHLANEDLIVVEGSVVPQSMRHLCVLGQGGQQFGVSFFDSRKAFERVLDAADTSRSVDRANGVTFGTLDELPFADADAWVDHALPVTGPNAYPLAADVRRNGTVRRPDARELTAAEALLRALADTSEQELDSGRWQKRVSAFDGPVELTLTLPLLLEAEAGEIQAPSPIRTTPRLAERSSVRIARMLENHTFASLDEVNAALDEARERGLFDLPADEAAGRELTPLERAQELAYDAMEVEGRLQVKRARQALALSADCADAWVILAEAAPTPEIALERYEQGVAAGSRAIGPDRFEALTGEFWGNLDTRPYMRARLGLAQTLRTLGRVEEAVSHYRELLRLNPNDNQGVRYLLVVELLERDRNEEAGALLEEYGDDIQALWPYARVVWLFRAEGDSARARACLQTAVRANPHAIDYLLHPRSALEEPSPFALGSREEAAYVADALADLCEATPGLLDWLRLQAQARRARTRTSRRPRRSDRRPRTRR